ncbi:hypothetical protein PGTUg99_006436 [Puccinia graminis f. sp. tritici]|uniref:Uncharacterized protein n=1 Tax=Puccinia graminis f. sp. tritici TaxID=56615 RepID=A0A5B0N203_PUCGR|nr:hypothetical protein PGTUg99_006436 [Puccinia graminis f. sp. tritici]
MCQDHSSATISLQSDRIHRVTNQEKKKKGKASVHERLSVDSLGLILDENSNPSLNP